LPVRCTTWLGLLRGKESSERHSEMASSSSSSSTGNGYLEDVSLELKYFPSRARSEQIRIMLAATNIPYTETTIQRADWPTLKETMPTKQIPVLIEKNNKTGKTFEIPQSISIMRHLARISGFYGTNEQEMARCDFIADTSLDFRLKLNAVAYNPLFLSDWPAVEKHFAEVVPNYLDILQTFLSQNQGGYFVCQKPTYADIMIFDNLDCHSQIKPNFLDGHKSLKEFVERIASLPNVAKYLQSRRPSDFEGKLPKK